MSNGGVSLIGVGESDTEKRAIEAVSKLEEVEKFSQLLKSNNSEVHGKKNNGVRNETIYRTQRIAKLI